MKPLSSFIFVLSGIALASCASTVLQVYEGPARPDDQTALVTVERPGSNRGDATIQIVSVDTPRGDIIPVTARTVRLLPRETCLGVRARSSSVATVSFELCFEAYAGRLYELRALTQGETVPLEIGDRNVGQGSFGVDRVYVIDISTQETVAYSGEPIDAGRSVPPAPQPIISVVPGVF